MSTLSQQIREKLQELITLEHASKRLAVVKEELNTLNQEWQEMDAQLDKELKDIQALEKISMKALFHKVLGSKEEQLEKERQEYLALNLKYKELNNTIKITEYEAEVLEKKLTDIDRITQELERLKYSREAEILRTDHPLKSDLLLLLNRIEKLERYDIELDQAISAGRAAHSMLGSVLKELSNAEHWGQWDMYNQGRYYDMQKHSAIDRATQQVYQANQLLKIYSKELQDVGYQGSFQLNIKSFSQFTDVFFDNIISDWIVQQKIKSTASNVESIRDKIIQLNESLKVEKYKTSRSIEETEEQKDKLLSS